MRSENDLPELPHYDSPVIPTTKPSFSSRFFALNKTQQILLSFIFLFVGTIGGAVVYYSFTDAQVPDPVREVLHLAPKATEKPKTALEIGMQYLSEQEKANETAKPKAGSDMGQILTGQKTQEFTAEQINSAHRSFFALSPGTNAKYAVDKHMINYVSQDKDGEPITILAQVFVPKVPAGTKMPVYVFGAGTTGLDDHCAPAKEVASVRNWGNYLQHMLVYASQGYIVVFPDYEGFNDPNRIHHYFNGKLEGQVLLDGARALKNYATQKNIAHEDQYFFAGYSEGGHAAFAVKDYAPTYAPDVHVGGVIGYGATSNIEALIRENPGLIPYLIYAYSDFYGVDNFNPKDYMQDKWVKTLREDVLRMCVDAMPTFYGSNPDTVYTPEFGKALYSRDLDGNNFGRIKKYFDENSTGYVKNDIPIYIVQGSVDPIVTVKSQKEFMKLSCQAGNKITYTEFAGVHHFQTRQVSLKESLDWMKKIREGQGAIDDCAKVN